MEKTNPIQLVKTRGQSDVFLKEGGGGNNVPSWATDDAIMTNASSLRESFGAFEELFAEREHNRNPLPVLFVATLNEHATAKSYRANARSIFDGRQKRNIIGVSDTNKLLVKIDNKSELDRISRNVSPDRLSTISKDKKFGIAAVTGIALFTPYIDDGIDTDQVKVKLVDYLNAELNRIAEDIFMTDCKTAGISVKRVDYASGVHVFCADIRGRRDVAMLATMDSVISVKKMPYIELSISPEPFNTQIELKAPIQGEDYPKVGLMDSGIETIPHLGDWMEGANQNIADLADEDINLRHGTAVAGILNYGDELQGQNWTGCSPMKITSCIINTDESNVRMYESEMIEHIKSSIRNNPDVKVWNLSQGSTTEVSDTSFSDFAFALDSLQKEFNILICKSAGNIDYTRPDETRICQGADSVRSLVVASAAHEYTGKGDALAGQKSPFSRVGPGPEFLSKPDIAHYGGNTNTGVCSFTETGYQCASLRGTSFSTPRITALAANLAHRLNRDFDPYLIKALLVHNATYPNVSGKDSKTLLNELGHGIPPDIDSILNNDNDEFTMIWQPDLSNDVQIRDIPFPVSLVEDGHFYGDITVTVVTDPILKPTEGSEYCQSDVEVLLQTYDRTQYYTLGAVGTSPMYRNSIRLVNPKNMLAKDLYSQRAMKTEYMEERTLIETAQKYQPIKKYHINLEQIRKGNLQYIESDRKWCLRINALYRDATIADREFDGVFDSVKATVIITIRDPKKKGIVYTECYRHLSEHNFEHSDIVIRQDINVGNNQ
ncbi:MAG: S8 family peptidase [Candidatus Cryptobacteroides sp.]